MTREREVSRSSLIDDSEHCSESIGENLTRRIRNWPDDVFVGFPTSKDHRLGFC